MKKIITLIIALAMTLSLAACSDKASNETNKETEDKVQIETETGVNEEASEDVEEDVSDKTPENKPSEDKNSSEKDEPVKNEKPEKEEKPQNKPSEDKNNTAEQKPQEQAPETKPESNENLSVGNKLLSEFKSAANSANAYGVAEKLASSSAVSEIGLATMEVEPGYLTGFDNAEITGFKEGAMFAPMIGTIPFVGYVFTLEDGTDANEFISTLKSSANLRWNICTTAEEMVAGSSGNKVFFVMCNKSFEE